MFLKVITANVLLLFTWSIQSIFSDFYFLLDSNFVFCFFFLNFIFSPKYDMCYYFTDSDNQLNSSTVINRPSFKITCTIFSYLNYITYLFLSRPQKLKPWCKPLLILLLHRHVLIGTIIIFDTGYIIGLFFFYPIKALLLIFMFLSYCFVFSYS